MLKHIYILLALALCATCLFENTYSVKQLKNAKAVKRVLYDMDQIALVYFWVEDCENCKNAQGLVEKVADENDGIFKAFHVDCEELWKDEEARSLMHHCEPQFRAQLPQISFYQPNINRNANQGQQLQAVEHRFQGEASPKSLASFGHKLMHPYRVRLATMEDFEKFQAKETKLNKVILFTEKKSTAPIYKALTLLYLQRLHFAEVVDSEDASKLLDEFDIEEYPQLYLLERNADGSGYTRERYEGDMIWKPLKQFLEQSAAQERVELEHPEDIFPQTTKEPRRARGQRGGEQQDQQQEQQQQKQQEPKGPVVKVFDENSFENGILKTEKPVLVHAYQEENAKHKNWDTLVTKYKSLFDYYQVQVTNENAKFVKESLSSRQYPTVRFFTVGNAQKKRANKVHFPADMDFEEIQKDIQDLIDDRSTGVSAQELQMKLQSGLMEGKVLVIMFYNTASVGLNFRVFSSLSDYSEKFRFLTFKDAPQPVLEQFQVRSQPQVVILYREVNNPEDLELELKQDQIRLAAYPGRFEFDQFAEFLNNFDSQRAQQSSKLLQAIDNDDKLEELCERKASVCFIGLLNGQHKKIQQQGSENKTRWEYQIGVMNKIKNAYGQKPVSFGYVDAFCHDELLLPLELSDDFLPNYIAYNPAKKQYQKMIGIFDYDSISRFVENQLKGRASTFNLKNALSLKEKNCQQVLEDRERQAQESALSNEDDDILKEILEEERLKREQIEKELKAEKKKKKKKSKKDQDDL